MAKFWDAVHSVIDEADILLEILDARLIDETRNLEIEKKVLETGKPLIYVINKADLVSARDLHKYKKKLNPAVFVSAKDRSGIKMLRTIVMSKSGSLKKVSVGVLGYPNVGKSSIINALAGGSKARTSSESGFTKGKQDIRASGRLKIIDTPGVIPYKEKDTVKHGLTATFDFAHVRDPDMIVYKIYTNYPGLIQKHFKVDKGMEFEDLIEHVARVNNKLLPGGVADEEASARIILKFWQNGTIRPK